MSYKYTLTATLANINPRNSTLSTNGKISIKFDGSSGTAPPAGSKLVSATMTLSAVQTYTGNSPILTSVYGVMPLSHNSETHSETDELTNAKDSILGLDVGDTLTFTASRSGTGTIINVRGQCTAALVLVYNVTTSSTGSLDKTSVAQSSSIKLTISPSDATFSHKVKWQRDSSNYSQQTISAGTKTTTFTIPANWPTGSAKAVLTTYLNGSVVGSSRSYSFTITIDTKTVKPTPGTLTAQIVQPESVPSDWGIYIKGLSKTKLTLTGFDAGGYDSTITDITYTYGTQSKSTDGKTELTSDAINDTGSVKCYATVSNSFGNYASTDAVTISVMDYNTPQISSIIAFRCDESGIPSDVGGYIAVTAKSAITSLSGNNSIRSITAAYKTSATEYGAEYQIENNRQSLIAGDLEGKMALTVRVSVIDAIGGTAIDTTKVLTSECVLFFKDGGLNVSVGKVGSKVSAVEINEDWDIWHGNTKLNGTVALTRGGTGGTSAAGGLHNLIAGAGSLSYSAIDSSDQLGISQTSTTTGKRITFGNFARALGFDTNGVLSVAKGGTGATVAADALSNLGAAASNHKHSGADITSGKIGAAYLPFKVAFGSCTINSDNGTKISYSSAGFSSAPSVIVTYSKDGQLQSGDIGAIKVYNKTKSQAYVIIGGNYSAKDADWIAIGT